jgi:thiol-disulfide isomerase/thioredoxin
MATARPRHTASFLGVGLAYRKRYHRGMHRLALALIPALLLAQPDPRELVRQSAEAIKQFRSYQLDTLVVIELRGGGLDNKLEMPTSISVRRPDRMRIESRNQTAGLIIVSDGEHTWFFLSSLKQYIKREASNSPEAAVSNSGILPKNLPDLKKSIKSVKITGEDYVEIEGEKIPCWVVETIFDKITLPEQDTSILDGEQITWISKTNALTLQTSFTSRLILPRIAEPVAMTQFTRTTTLKLNVDLPDSLFAFTPPAGAKETADWTLPGVVRPDVIGKPAPAFKAKALDGTDIDLSALHGKVVLIDFWATWCGPCKREIPSIEKIYNEFREKGLVVLGMSVGEDQATVAKFVKTAAVTYPILQVNDTAELVAGLSVNAFPTVVLIDRDGKVASYEAGARGEAALRADLAKLGIGATANSK